MSDKKTYKAEEAAQKRKKKKQRNPKKVLVACILCIAIIGGMIFATTVLTTRTIFLFVDKGWKCPYTKLAIPAESAFVVALWVCFFLSQKYI